MVWADACGLLLGSSAFVCRTHLQDGSAAWHIDSFSSAAAWSVKHMQRSPQTESSDAITSTMLQRSMLVASQAVKVLGMQQEGQSQRGAVTQLT